MKVNIIAEKKLSHLENYYPKFFRYELAKKFDIKFFNINSKDFSFYNICIYLKNNNFPTILVLDESIKNITFFLLFRIFHVPTIYFHAHENFTLSNFNRNISYCKKFFFFLKSWDKKIFNILIFLNIFKKIDILFSSNVEEINYWKTKKKTFLGLNIYFKKFSKLVKINDKSFDEIIAVTEKKKKTFYSFIDIALPYHKDQLNFGYTPMFKDYYFQNLFSILKRINKIFNLEVHIILHPSYKPKDYAKDYKGFNFITNVLKKNNSIANSKFVLLHHTSAIFKAINFNKPIIQLSSKKFNSFIKNYDNNFKIKFKLDRIYIEEKSDTLIKKIITKNLKNKNNLKNKYNSNINNFDIFFSNIRKLYV
jgi:hypothetical protein